MELQPISTTAPVTIEKRYELIYQPVVIDVPIKPMEGALDIYDKDSVALYLWLDLCAQEAVIKAVSGNPDIGDEVRSSSYNIAGLILNQDKPLDRQETVVFVG